MTLVRRQVSPRALRDVFALAGAACVAWYEDTGDCHFCNPTPEAHEPTCPLYTLYVPPPGDTKPHATRGPPMTCPGCEMPAKLQGFDLLVLGLVSGPAIETLKSAMCPEHRAQWLPAMMRALQALGPLASAAEEPTVGWAVRSTAGGDYATPVGWIVGRYLFATLKEAEERIDAYHAVVGSGSDRATLLRVLRRGDDLVEIEVPR